MLEITEIFHSLQGEGPFSGRPAVFLRLSGCVEPLCPWCDTMYSCAPGQPMKIDDIYDSLISFNTNLIVITGGEPFLQWNNGLARLERRLIDGSHLVQYETSGKIEIPADTGGFTVCSPKYIEKTWHFDTNNLSRVQAFKFVADGDFDTIKLFIDSHCISADHTFIMPKGVTQQAQLEKFQQSWEFCVANGFNFSPRLHVLAFNNKRGI